MYQAAGLLGGGEGLGDERPGPAAARADAAEPNAQVIVACHHVRRARYAAACAYNDLQDPAGCRSQSHIVPSL
jgi:hypothetical protein